MEDLLRRTLGERDRARAGPAPAACGRRCAIANQLENAILNLAINARDAMPDGGKLTIETGNAHLDERLRRQAARCDGRRICLRLRDRHRHRHVAETLAERVFEPFFTTKPIGQGTGLGLSMIYGFAQQSRRPCADRQRGRQGHDRSSSTCRATAARHGEDDAPHDADAPAAPATARPCWWSRTSRSVRALIVDVLRELGYRALEARDGPAGLADPAVDTRGSTCWSPTSACRA